MNKILLIAFAALIDAGCASMGTEGGIPGVLAPGVTSELVQEG